MQAETDYYPEFDDMWSYAPHNQIEPNPFFKNLEISQQASNNFCADQYFLDDWYFGRFLKWLHLIKFQICFWLNLKKQPYHDRFAASDGVACTSFRSDVGGCEAPYWAASWDEYKVGIGWANWFYEVEWESNW
jgi:hypothetical protein